MPAGRPLSTTSGFRQPTFDNLTVPGDEVRPVAERGDCRSMMDGDDQPQIGLTAIPAVPTNRFYATRK
jgi:hypothetical protein